MRVLSNSPRQPRLSRIPEQPRLRPGERPVWVTVPAGISSDRLRVGVDALASALVERSLAQASITLADVLAAAEDLPDVHRLAPTPELRRWELELGGTDEPVKDDLPEVCLPAGLLSGAGRDLASLLGDGSRDAYALAAERAASRHGRTLEAHLLASALLTAR